MRFQFLILTSFVLGAISAPIDDKASMALKSEARLLARDVEGIFEEKTKRSSPVPPLWDGGVEFEGKKIQRSSPVPPLWDGGVEFEEEKTQ
ncbi:hypothetical protein F4810DRAFT_669589 [Camillea tinctor]|nr:hypothetical protein F4810DRAFT_669589 [Camillea tinctor]